FEPDVIVSDIKMPKMDGFQFWAELRSRHKKTPPMIFITGHGDKAAAIEALREGAFDYLEKPFDTDELLHSIEKAFTKQRLEAENADLACQLALANEKLKTQLEARTELVRRIQKPAQGSSFTVDALGKSAAVFPVKEAIARLASNPMGSDMSVLVTGPSGSGKEVVARLIHETSARAKGPFVPVNCGALPDNLIESELFGHEKGAFTGANAKRPGVFEMADGGTLFLDEIGELPQAMQAKLLRAIQEKCFRRVGGTEEIQVNVRVVSATNRDLAERVREGTFREDLLYRLNTMPIRVPSLRERAGDIAVLAHRLLVSATGDWSEAPKDFDPEAVKTLQQHAWPGNIRELKSCVQRAALLTNGGTITAGAVREALGVEASVTPIRMTAIEGGGVPVPTDIPYHSWKKQFMHSMERQYLADQLERHHGNVSAVAKSIGVNRPNLCRLLKKHHLLAGKFRKAA
ncbi:MAG: sigma-54-dependent Fis family transcriptional regulator, partial [Bdellovibrionales bacterium]|nr:sigma-54-dependent Fis family transcriptional regulator [Bdellovibrionales bacterium]